MTYLDDLNKKQLEAVMYTEGPLLILAGAGSGKTSTMTHRIAYLIKEKGVDPYNILAVTFTNKAAGEMRERVEKLLGGPNPVWIMTFHAACLRILRTETGLSGYTRDFAVYDPVDQKAVIKSIIKEDNIEEKDFPYRMLISVISKCKEAQHSPEDYRRIHEKNLKTETIYNVYKKYEEILKKNNAMDFDDLLLNAVKLFEENEEIILKYRTRFRYVMVDEYQDTNRIQYRLIKMLAQEHKNLCVVGDDDQCIYQWRGADISNILNFEKDFPGTKVVKLEQNYRSTGNILKAAYSVIKNNIKRKPKMLWTESEEGSKIIYCRADDEKAEAHYVAQGIDRLCGPGKSFSDFAVLYRTNVQSRTFEEAFSSRDIPYRVVGGTRYYERKEIKDMMAYMRLVQNPDDDLSLARIINEPKRGVGQKTLDKLKALASVRGQSVFSVLGDEEIMASLSGRTGRELKQMHDAVESYSIEKNNLRVSDIYDGLLVASGYIKALEAQKTTEADGRIENLMEFKSVIYDYEKETIGEEVSLTGFLEKIALLSDVDNHDPSENAVVLMTLHSAKGLEFDFVFMPGMEDGLFPGWRKFDETDEMEEERRLCYVGMTRAKERLCFTSAAYRTMYGRGDYTRESSFLRELDPKLTEGDAIFRKREEIKLGEKVDLDGFSKEEPLRPFEERFSGSGNSEMLRKAVSEVHEKSEKKENFIVGDKVAHSKFGPGLVVSSRGKVITVIFDKAGTKKLAADIAPLRKIEE
ncbi:MAG TPA: UvrD-helicase domain-containing protein [Bacillota bacterium]|nr:UvrD-helicase domain-containing protein [Bacillota bacterium]